MNHTNDKRMLKDTLQKLIADYGADAVQHSLNKIITPKTGRPKIADWEKMMPMLGEDVNEQLGHPSGNKRSNKSIAMHIASQAGNHSSDATVRRIMRKLSKDRDHYTLVLAALNGAYKVPWTTYLEVTRKLAQGHRNANFWKTQLNRAEDIIASFEKRFGAPRDYTTYYEILVKIASLDDRSSIGLKGLLPS